VLEKSNAKHLTNKEGFSMMMNKKKNKSKKRKVQLTWELMSKLLELIESTKRGGGVRWVRLFILVKFSRSSECDK
jgi:hypothetical protein